MNNSRENPSSVVAAFLIAMAEEMLEYRIAAACSKRLLQIGVLLKVSVWIKTERCRKPPLEIAEGAVVRLGIRNRALVYGAAHIWIGFQVPRFVNDDIGQHGFQQLDQPMARDNKIAVALFPSLETEPPARLCETWRQLRPDLVLLSKLLVHVHWGHPSSARVIDSLQQIQPESGSSELRRRDKFCHPVCHCGGAQVLLHRMVVRAVNIVVEQD